jgi:hypothetical protein
VSARCPAGFGEAEEADADWWHCSVSLLWSEYMCVGEMELELKIELSWIEREGSRWDVVMGKWC